MPLTTESLQEVFKITGKLVYLSELAAPQIVEYSKTSMALVDQAISGEASERSIFKNVCTPIDSAVEGVINSLSGVPNQALTNMNAYLRTVISKGVDLPLGADPKLVLDEMILQMIGLGETVLQNGKFYSYFNTNFGKQLPTAAASSETIPDTWVTNQVID